jgi:hypothetical protein
MSQWWLAGGSGQEVIHGLDSVASDHHMIGQVMLFEGGQGQFDVLRLVLNQ